MSHFGGHHLEDKQFSGPFLGKGQQNRIYPKLNATKHDKTDNNLSPFRHFLVEPGQITTFTRPLDVRMA